MHSGEHTHAHAHDHGHAHAHAGAPHPRAMPGFSLLRMSGLGRLAIAGVAVAFVWLAVFWAMQ